MSRLGFGGGGPTIKASLTIARFRFLSPTNRTNAEMLHPHCNVIIPRLYLPSHSSFTLTYFLKDYSREALNRSSGAWRLLGGWLFKYHCRCVPVQELSDCKTPETRLPPVLLCVGNSVSGLKSWAGLLLLKIFDLGTLWGHLIRQSDLILSSSSPGIEDEIGLSNQMSSGYVNVDVKCWRRHWQKYSMWQR